MWSLSPDAPRRKTIRPALVCLALLLPAQLPAAELTLTPALSLREEYNDNVFALTTERRSDFLTTVSPALAFARRSERVNAALSGGANAVQYLHHPDSSAVGFFAAGSGSWAAAPRLSLSGDLSYVRDSGASSIDPATLLAITSRTERHNYRVGGRYSLSERASASLALGYARDGYDNPGYLDAVHQQGSVGVDFDLGRTLPATVLGTRVELKRDDTDLSRVESLSGTVGVVKSLDELWRVSVNGGARFTRSRFVAAGEPGRQRNEEVGGVGNLALAYSGERLSGSATLSHDLAGASGRGAATKVTGVNLSLQQRFSEDLSATLAGGWAWSRSRENQFSGQALDERSRNLGLGVRYRLLQAPDELSLEASYSYHETDYRLAGTEMLRNVIALRLEWQHQLF